MSVVRTLLDLLWWDVHARMGRIGGGDAAGIINSAIIVWVIAGLSWFWLN